MSPRPLRPINLLSADDQL